uniref:Glutaredoxin-like protein n=1 Tax=Cyprinodon variegatus TaxID=28743 RepID=A0A3Q2E2A6_CYPVA
LGWFWYNQSKARSAFFTGSWAGLLRSAPFLLSCWDLKGIDPCPLCDEAKELLQPFKHRVRLTPPS